MQFNQFIPQEFCLQCNVCCRFSEARSIWAPMFMDSEIIDLVGKNILPSMLFSGVLNSEKTQSEDSRPINLVQHDSCFICPCFNPAGHKCKIYIHRPFDCRIYPFLLLKKYDKFFLAQDKKCPYLDSLEQDKINGHIAYLKKEFAKAESLSFLKQNRALFGQYPDTDITVLFPIKMS